MRVKLAWEDWDIGSRDVQVVWGESETPGNSRGMSGPEKIENTIIGFLSQGTAYKQLRRTYQNG